MIIILLLISRYPAKMMLIKCLVAAEECENLEGDACND